MIPAVITSRAARKDLNRIKSEHSLILEGFANHNVRMEALSQQKAAEQQALGTAKMEMDKSKMVADTATQKNSMDFSLKQQELDIKRAALSSTD